MRRERGSVDLFLKDNDTTKQLVFKSFHCHRKVNNAAQCTDLPMTQIGDSKITVQNTKYKLQKVYSKSVFRYVYFDYVTTLLITR